jgi:hypothetical protein
MGGGTQRVTQNAGTVKVPIEVRVVSRKGGVVCVCLCVSVCVGWWLGWLWVGWVCVNVNVSVCVCRVGGWVDWLVVGVNVCVCLYVSAA